MTINHKEAMEAAKREVEDWRLNRRNLPFTNLPMNRTELVAYAYIEREQEIQEAIAAIEAEGWDCEGTIVVNRDDAVRILRKKLGVPA